MLSFEASHAVAPELIVLEAAGSTNDELAAMAAGGAPAPYTTVVTADQTAGRGRRDRAWSTPPGLGLAISVLLPRVAADRAPWLPLAAGLAMRDAVATVLPAGAAASVKWPNDVLVGGRKVCGVLAQLTPSGVVMGAGLNVRLGEADLPVPTATSLVLAGSADVDDLDDRVLAAYLGRLRELVDGLAAQGAAASGLHRAVEAACDTIGRDVRVELPGGAELRGRATGIAADGRLVVRSGGGDELVAAGDVVHVR